MEDFLQTIGLGVILAAIAFGIYKYFEANPSDEEKASLAKKQAEFDERRRKNKILEDAQNSYSKPLVVMFNRKRTISIGELQEFIVSNFGISEDEFKFQLLYVLYQAELIDYVIKDKAFKIYPDNLLKPGKYLRQPHISFPKFSEFVEDYLSYNSKRGYEYVNRYAFVPLGNSTLRYVVGVELDYYRNVQENLPITPATRSGKLFYGIVLREELNDKDLIKTLELGHNLLSCLTVSFNKGSKVFIIQSESISSDYSLKEYGDKQINWLEEGWVDALNEVENFHELD